MRYTIGILIAAAAVGVCTLAAQDRKPVKTIEDGVLDELRLYVEKLPATSRVVIRPFSATDADITEGAKGEETRKMQTDAPPMLAQQFVSKLRELGPFSDVTAIAPDAAGGDALLVDGKFIEMDPGSRAKRYFVGFGAGKSGVTVEGSVKAADGSLLATFKQRRIGTMGAFGGDSMAKLVGDTKDIGEDLAKFLSTWANGKKLD